MVISTGSVVKFLGVAQKLLGAQATENGAGLIFSGIFEHLPLSVYEPQLQTILGLLFVRLQSNKTVKYMKIVVACLAMLAVKAGPSVLLARVDSLQPRLFLNLLENVWLPTCVKIEDPIDRKVCAVAMVGLLTECPDMLNENYGAVWPKVLAATLSLFEPVVSHSDDGEDDAAFLEGDAGYSNAYTALHNAAPVDRDPLPTVAWDKQALLRPKLQALAAREPRVMQSLPAGLI